jgi:hypothetical protein
MDNANLLKWVRDVLVTGPSRWQSLTEALPNELLVARPAPGEWSAVECLQHILDTERVFNFRLQAFLEGRDFPAFNPDQEGMAAGPAHSPASLAAEFSRQRAASLKALDRITSADLERGSHHAELGPVVLKEMLNEWAGHDLMHTVQAERAMMQPFIQDCGPWVIYFKDHEIKPV